MQRPWKNIFEEASQFAFNLLRDDEILNLNLSAEDTTFIRFNKSKVRQLSEVEQCTLSLDLYWKSKKYSKSFNLSRNQKSNEQLIRENLDEMKRVVRELPDDPYIALPENNGESVTENSGELITNEAFLNLISENCASYDLAGVYAAGKTCRANANSLGQKHWYSGDSFSFDFSLYSAKEKAVKGSYGGANFKSEDCLKAIEDCAQALKVMERERKVLSPGKYRCYLAPAALQEIVDIMRWHGLSAGAHQRGECAFGLLKDGDRKLSPKFSMLEDFSLGLSPRFNERGEVFAESMEVIKNGELKNLFVSSSTAKEYGLESNYASDRECHRSARILAGNLKREDILKELGTGLYLSNLHYLNWSDKQKARITGMTRFGCLWVENGEVVGPIKDLRFDETLYHLFGDGLLELTEFVQTHVETMTYGERHIGGTELPGILVKDMSFTL